MCIWSCKLRLGEGIVAVILWTAFLTFCGLASTPNRRPPEQGAISEDEGRAAVAVLENALTP